MVAFGRDANSGATPGDPSAENTGQAGSLALSGRSEGDKAGVSVTTVCARGLPPKQRWPFVCVQSELVLRGRPWLSRKEVSLLRERDRGVKIQKQGWSWPQGMVRRLR